MDSTTPLLRATGVTKVFAGVTALDDVDFTVMPGQVMCLAGENGCGKSTLVKVVSGVYLPEQGSVDVGGESIHLGRPRSAIDAGIQVIFQDLALFDHLSVEENIAFSRMLAGRKRLTDRRAIRAIAEEQLERIGIELDLRAPVASLSIANKQIVAICRALSMNARVLFMDEPTTALTSNEVDRLLAIVLDLKRRGLSVVFISHKLDEVFKIADTITILRDGVKVGDFEASSLDTDSLTLHMTGRSVKHSRYKRARSEDAPLLETRHLSRNGHYEDLSVGVRPGDVVGLTGLLGSGRTEFALSLFGLNPPNSGQILCQGTPVSIDGPWDALAKGIALLPEDRKSQALFLSKSVEQNISSASLGTVVNKFGDIVERREHDLAQKTVRALNVNNKDVSMIVGNLSGGNQQKVVIGKWMAAGPKVLILDSPTVGIDIGSKDEIYSSIRSLAGEGMGVIVISDEAEEIAAICNRAIVMHEGRVVEVFEEVDMRAADFRDRLARVIANPRSLGDLDGDGVPAERRV